MAVSYGMSHLGRHCIAAQQLSLTKMYALLEMQHANGAIISYDHASADAVKLWLQAGRRYFQSELRKRASSNIVRKLFGGTIFGLMGDGSTDTSRREQEAAVS